MAISIIGTGASDFDNNSSNTLNYPWPSGYSPVAGDIALVIQSGWADADAPTIPTPSGYTYLGIGTRLAGSLYISVVAHYKVLNGSESAPSVASNTSWGLGGGSTVECLGGNVTILRGVDQNTPIDATTVFSEGAAANTFQPTGITTATNGAMVISVAVQGDDNNLSLNTANGFTEITGFEASTTLGQDHVHSAAYKADVNATASNAPIWSGGFPDSWSCVTIAFRAATVPAQMAAPTVTANAVGGFNVSYSAPSNGGSPIISYSAYYNSGGGWTWYNEIAGTSFNATGFGNGVAVQWAIYSSNAIGWSVQGVASSAVTTWNVPNQVTTLSASNSGSGNFGLTWTPPANNGTAITDYLVEWSYKGVASWNTWSHSALGAASSCTVTGLQSIYSYDFRVRAINAVGTASSVSNTATAEGKSREIWGGIDLSGRASL